MMDYLDACKNHMDAAKMHMEKGKTLYHDAEHAEERGLERAESALGETVDQQGLTLCHIGLLGWKPSLQDEVAFESAGKWFALAIDELNKHLGSSWPMGWPLAIVPDTHF